MVQEPQKITTICLQDLKRPIRGAMTLEKPLGKTLEQEALEKPLEKTSITPY